MPDEKGDNLVPFSCRLEAEQIDFINDMAKRRVLGHNRRAVLRGLLNYAMQDIVKTDFIQKYLAARAALKKG